MGGGRSGQIGVMLSRLLALPLPPPHPQPIHPSLQTNKITTRTQTQRQVELHKRQRLAPYDVALKGFKYHEALDAALAQRNPRTIVAVLEELIMRRVRVKRDGMDWLDCVVGYMEWCCPPVRKAAAASRIPIRGARTRQLTNHTSIHQHHDKTQTQTQQTNRACASR